MKKYNGTMSYAMDEVKKRLEPTGISANKVKIIEGYMSRTKNNKEKPFSVSFAYIDFDLYTSIKDALLYLEFILSSGGFIVVDDYGFFSTGVKKAVDEFVRKRKNFAVTLPVKNVGNFCILQKS